MKNRLKYLFLYLFAGIQILSPIWQALFLGYDSIGMFFWDILSGAVGMALCLILVDLLKRVHKLEQQTENDK